MKAVNLRRALGLVVMLPAAALAGKEVNEQWQVDAKAAVSVENVAGEIVIEGWDRNEVRLTGELGNSVRELETVAEKSSLRLRVVNRDERHPDDTSLRLRVPHGAGVDASGVSAEIDIAGLDNEKLAASSVSGDISVAASSQWVSLESVSGDLDFSGRTQRISAESVSGDIDLSGIAGAIEATTVSGDMDLRAGPGLIDSAKLESVSGDIEAAAGLSASGRLSAESMSGDIAIRLPAAQAGLFRAESFSGRIETDFGSVEAARYGPGRHLKHVAGSSGAEILVESFSGNILIKHE